MTNTALSHAEYEDRRYLPSLDGLRGIAVAFVITCHLHDKMWSALSGYVGVSIFFVLSGYLITRLALREEVNTGCFNVLTFYVRRTFRIFPLYYLMLGIYSALILGFHVSPEKSTGFKAALPYYASYLQELPFWRQMHNGGAMPAFYQSWSLGIEEKFYLFWPLLIVFVPHRRWMLRTGLVLVGIVLCSVEGFVSEGTGFYHLDSYGAILMGVLLALLLSRPAIYGNLGRVSSSIAPLALGLALATQLWLMPHTHFRGLSTLYSLTATLLIAHLLIFGGSAERFLGSRSLAFVGRMSYGIYLVHILCIGVVEHIVKPQHGLVPSLVAYAGTFGLSLGCAYLLHISVERPLMGVGKQLSMDLGAKRKGRSDLSDQEMSLRSDRQSNQPDLRLASPFDAAKEIV